MNKLPSSFAGRIRVVATIGIATLLAGCAGTRSVVFVTKTSLGILDADTTPPTLSVAYDRTEGYFGPSYENGSAPPVYAVIQSGGSIFDPKIRQLYATGEAAKIATSQNGVPAKETLAGNKRVMFFGTSTSVGFKLTFATDSPVPTSLSFGFKRKEASFIPIGTIDGQDYYPSVLAAIDTTARMGQSNSAGLEVAQVFATGEAAQNLAFSLRDEFKWRLQSAGLHVAGAPAPSAAAAVLAIYDHLSMLANDPAAARLVAELDALGPTVPAIDFPYYFFPAAGQLNKAANRTLSASGYSRVNEYVGTLFQSIASLESVKANPAGFKDPSGAALASPELIEIGTQLESQKRKLATYLEAFAREPVVGRATAYFNQSFAP